MRYTESNVPEHLRVQVVHRPPRRRKDRYQTYAMLRDRETDALLAIGHSKCSREDAPSRKVGRAVAVGRALKSYFKEEQTCGAL